MSNPIRYTSHLFEIIGPIEQKIESALENYEVEESSAWQELSDLSANTVFDGIEVYGDSVIKDGDDIIIAATIYVTLNYDINSNDPVSFNDSYPARVYFTLSPENEILIQNIEADTRSFYE
ncbi:MAG: hypothetical protein H2040_11770 [Euryhalocaulis sp.]|uniref:pPIWI-associating nuclease domain-containing protein n=1 Tax=Euryhalocaulis sp. TaxID=2744307 RepID=UPI0017EF0555|nr:hypothetical protein [Euryhalocaulis sp.]MBA4802527.1 hypothetical protein [Euryhalocaulis sp.]